MFSRTSFCVPFTQAALAVAMAGVFLPAQVSALTVTEPNDPSHLTQWYLRDGPAGIGAYASWAIAASRGTSQAVVGVIDTHIELTNKELKNRLVTGWDGRNDQPYPVGWLLGASMHGTRQ